MGTNPFSSDRRKLVTNVQELETVVGVGITRRRTGRQQRNGTGQLVFAQPASREVAPARRIGFLMNGMHAKGKGQPLADRVIGAQRHDPR